MFSLDAKNKKITSLIDLTAGSLGGSAVVFVGQPLDTIKVKMQTFPDLYKSSIKCFKSTLIREGFFRGLYAGTVPALVANIAENSVLFCAYGFCQDILTNSFKNYNYLNDLFLRYSENEKKTVLNPLGNATAGFLSAFFSSFTLCPTELIKCKLQAARETNNKNITTFKLTNEILKTEGITGLFRGLTSTFAREMPGYFFFFGGYEFSKNLLTSNNQKETNLLITSISGGIGGVCLWTVIFPFDVCKSKIQVESSKKSMTKVMLEIAEHNGFKALYNGLIPTLLRTFPASAALFVAYEYSKEFLIKTLNV